MTRHIYDDEPYAHFVTFSCYRRRRLLDHDRPKRIVVEILSDQMSTHPAKCVGFVVMPDHVHAVLWFARPNQLSTFMKQWKQRTSFHIKEFLKASMVSYAAHFDLSDPVWQARYYDFNIHSDQKLWEKVGYMHANPVSAGLARSPCEWEFSSARWYEKGESVGVPIDVDV